MATVKLYKGPKTESNVVNYKCATFDFENATADLDYVIDNQATGTMPTTSEELKQIRLHITLAGINYLSGYEESSSSKENLVPPPVYDLGEGTSANPFDISEVELVPLGEKPADWELRYMDKYFTRTVSQYNNAYYANYASAGVAHSGVFYPDWDEETQYYEVPNFAQIFYTDATGFFGVSRSLNPTASGIQETVRALYNRRPYGSNNYYPGEFWWKANGAFGTQLFPQSLATSQKVMINMSSSQANAMNTYQSRLLVQMIRFDYEEETYTGIVVITLSADGLPQEAQITALGAPFWKEEITPANGGPISGIQGGHGTFDGTSDNYGDRTGSIIKNKATLWNSAKNRAGAMYKKYRTNYNTSGDATGIPAFTAFMQQLWAIDDDGSDALWKGFTNKFASPDQAVITYHLMPAVLAPDVSGDPHAIRIAGNHLVSGEYLSPIFGDMVKAIHVGSININEYTSSFADYTNCSIYIHLPYIGTKQIDTSAVMDGWLSVDYSADVLTGDCTAFITTCDKFGNTRIRYSFKGNCASPINIKSRVPANTQVMGALGQAAVGVAATVAGGVIAGAVAGSAMAAAGSSKTSVTAQNTYRQSVGSTIAQTAAQSAGSIATSASQAALSGQNITGSNAEGGSVSSQIDTRCYLIITRPQWSNPELYDNQKAYPSDISGTIAGDGFSGFLQTQTIKLNGITATDEERYEIATRMNAGVYV